METATETPPAPPPTTPKRGRFFRRDFLAGAEKRSDAAMDLLWSVLNTREFLFQH